VSVTRKPRAKAAALVEAWQRDRMVFRKTMVTLPDGRRFGDVMSPQQVEDAEGLDQHRHGYIEAGRGYGKTWTASVEVATELITRPGAQVYCVAADEDQARLILADAVGIFERAPLLRGLAKSTRTGLTIAATGSKLTVLPSDAPSAFGLRPSLVICDEIAEWPHRKMWDVMYSSLGKVPGARIICVGTAGWDQTSIAWEVRGIATSEPDWYFVSRQEPAPWIDPAWIEAQRRTLPAHTFARLIESRWVDGAGAFLSADEVGDVFRDVPAPDTVVYRALGLDLGLSKDSAVLALVGVCADGTVLILALATYTPRRGERLDLREIEEETVRTALLTDAPLALDPWQAVLLGQRAQAQGVAVHEFSFTSDSRRKLFGRVLDLIRMRSLKCGPHDLLRRELLGLETSETLSGWRVDHKVGQHDDHVVAVALAVAALAAMQLVETDISPAEGARLRAFSKHFGGAPMLPSGYALAYDDQGEPLDRRFAGFADGGPDMSGYMDGNVNTDYLEPR